MRWKEFLSAFLHFMKFVDQTDKNEEELRIYENELVEVKIKHDKAQQGIEDINNSNEEFELDEKEIALNEQLPAIQKQFNSLKSSKSRLETETHMASEK